MVHMVQQEPSLSPAEKTFFRLTCAGEGRISSYWWHQGDAYLSSYNKYNGDYRAKRFKCWHQLACMMFAHIRQENSLRDIDIALNAHANKLYHISIPQCPKSTLADANGRRDYRIYEEFAKTLMHQARRDYAHTQLAIDVDNAVYALDASVID